MLEVLIQDAAKTLEQCQALDTLPPFSTFSKMCNTRTGHIQITAHHSTMLRLHFAVVTLCSGKEVWSKDGGPVIEGCESLQYFNQPVENGDK